MSFETESDYTYLESVCRFIFLLECQRLTFLFIPFDVNKNKLPTFLNGTWKKVTKNKEDSDRTAVLL
jgi:hypothetical protein